MNLSEIESIVASLNDGGILLIPTDTVYGLAVKPTTPAAVNRLFEMKERPKDRHLPIMIASKEDTIPLGLASTSNVDKLFESKFVPGELSIVMGFADKPLVDWLKGRNEAMVRMPDDQRLLAILKQSGPLLVTSANKHAHPHFPETVAEILEQLHGKPDYIIDEGKLNNPSSTIINCRVDPPVVERIGNISEEELETLLNIKIK